MKSLNPVQKPFKTRLEIAQEYGISRKTLYRKLKASNLKLSTGLLNRKEQTLIYNILSPNKSQIK